MVWLAPMIGLTEHAFRTLFARHFNGVDCALTPFITLVEGKRVKQSHLKDILPENNPLMPIVPQVIGNSSRLFITMANQLQDMGFSEVNWNLGCPIERIATKKRGSGLLPYPELIDEILEKTLEKSSINISVKVRTGYSNASELEQVIPVLNRFPLASVTIHPRTGIQLYGGTADADGFGHYYKKLEAPVIYNGDILSYEDYLYFKNRFPEIDQWMLGRGLIFNPFLGEQIKNSGPKSQIEAKQRFEHFNRDLVDFYKSKCQHERYLLNKMKEYWGFFSQRYSNGTDYFERLKQTKTTAELELIFEEIYTNGDFAL